MWVLVFINFMFNADSGHQEPVIEAWYEYESMYQCFAAREQLAVELGSTNGYYPRGTMATCVYLGEDGDV